MNEYLVKQFNARDGASNIVITNLTRRLASIYWVGSDGSPIWRVFNPQLCVKAVGVVKCIPIYP